MRSDTPRLTRVDEVSARTTLRWAVNGQRAYPANQRDLTGSYPLTWQDYSSLPNPNGQFRWVAATIW
jgi:hypothetical protein